MEYHYDNKDGSYKAKLNVSDQVNCEKATCSKNEILNLTECENKNVTISHNSCGTPNKILNLEVPPGKYKLVSICIFTKQYNSMCLSF